MPQQPSEEQKRVASYFADTNPNKRSLDEYRKRDTPSGNNVSMLIQKFEKKPKRIEPKETKVKRILEKKETQLELPPLPKTIVKETQPELPKNPSSGTTTILLDELVKNGDPLVALANMYVLINKTGNNMSDSMIVEAIKRFLDSHVKQVEFPAELVAKAEAAVKELQQLHQVAVGPMAKLPEVEPKQDENQNKSKKRIANAEPPKGVVAETYAQKAKKNMVVQGEPPEKWKAKRNTVVPVEQPEECKPMKSRLEYHGPANLMLHSPIGDIAIKITSRNAKTMFGETKSRTPAKVRIACMDGYTDESLKARFYRYSVVIGNKKFYSTARGTILKFIKRNFSVEKADRCIRFTNMEYRATLENTKSAEKPSAPEVVVKEIKKNTKVSKLPAKEQRQDEEEDEESGWTKVTSKREKRSKPTVDKTKEDVNHELVMDTVNRQNSLLGVVQKENEDLKAMLADRS